MAKEIINGEYVQVKVSATKMAKPYETNEGTFVETAYKLENSLSRDKEETTVFLDKYKTYVYKKAELELSVTCRQATGDAGQEILKNAFNDNGEVFLAWTKDYRKGVWNQTKVLVGEYQDGLEVGAVTDVTYSLALASGAELEEITKPGE